MRAAFRPLSQLRDVPGRELARGQVKDALSAERRKVRTFNGNGQ